MGHRPRISNIGIACNLKAAARTGTSSEAATSYLLTGDCDCDTIAVMGTLSLLLIFPILWPFAAAALWKSRITPMELALNLTVGCLISVAGYYASLSLQALDVEVHNGRVTSKEQDQVSCSHSYSCNCRQSCTGTGASRSCIQTCDTCYEHSHDYDWVLHTEVGNITLDRIDRQGAAEPPRYSRAKRGDPVAVTKNYESLIKAAPDSLFNASSEKMLKARYAEQLLNYPSEVQDYHYVNRVLTQGVSLPEQAAWNQGLQDMLATLGPRKQVNAVLVFSKEPDPQYAEALRAHWLGGKKNDVVVVFGTPGYPKISWVRVFSWTDRELFKVELRDELQAMESVDRPAVLALLSQKIETSFARKSMKDFEYLRNEIQPPLWVAILLAAVSLVASVFLSRYFARN